MGKVELSEKDLLTPEEAIVHFDFSRRKWYQFLEKEVCKEFLVFFRKRKLIVRVKFEKFLKENPGIKEELANGNKGRPQKRCEE